LRARYQARFALIRPDSTWLARPTGFADTEALIARLTGAIVGRAKGTPRI